MKENKPKILVLFYSMYGHTFRMASAVVEGVREAGGEPVFKQVTEPVPENLWNKEMKKAKELMKGVPVADPRKDLKGIDGMIIGSPTRFGNMCAQMRNFWDQTGGTGQMARSLENQQRCSQAPIPNMAAKRPPLSRLILHFYTMAAL